MKSGYNILILTHLCFTAVDMMMAIVVIAAVVVVVSVLFLCVR